MAGMMQRLAPLTALALGFAANIVLANDIYVDALGDAATPDGSSAAPFTALKDAVTAANVLSGDSTIHVRGGVGRIYEIDGAEDLMTVTVSSLTITSWGADKPVFHLSRDLCVATNSPSIITFAAGADYGAVSNLVFNYHCETPVSSNDAKKESTGNKSGNSLGLNGKILVFTANHCTVDGCEFHQAGAAQGNGSPHVIASDAGEKTVNSQGTHLTVRNCFFDRLGWGDKRMVQIAGNAQIFCNVYTNCTGYFFPIKGGSGGYFASNRVVNCSQPIYGSGGNYNEFNDGEIAYNIFVNSGVDFFVKSTQYGTSGSVRFHHNTVVGCENFIWVKDVYKMSWKPWIFDNLIVTTDGGSVIREDATSLATRLSSFKSGSFFSGNAYWTHHFNAGTAPAEFDEYALGLTVTDDNHALAVQPQFIETNDYTSADFYRLNAARYPWVTQAAGASGQIGNATVTYEATYIGAVKPSNEAGAPGEFFRVDGVALNLSTSVPPATAIFEVSFSLNAGEVTFEWDLDGDGLFETDTGTANVATNIYAAYGDYLPYVRLTDAGTGRSLVAALAASPIRLRYNEAYVDANAPAGGDGSAAHPFTTIAEGVSACGAHAAIHVRGGPSRTYTIATADDLIVIPERYMSIDAYGGEGNASVVLDPGLGNAVPNASVITIPDDSVYATVSGLDFVWYGTDGGANAGDSLGRSGRAIDIYGGHAMVSNCTFRQVGQVSNPSSGEGGYAAIATRSIQGDTGRGDYLEVRGCRFENAASARQLTAVCQGLNAIVSDCLFSNCYQVVYPVKGAFGSFAFVTNVMVDCRAIYTTYGSWGEWSKPEIAHNIFVTSDGQPFIYKNGNHGLTGNGCRIHHNTVVGSTNFIEVANTANSPWQPQIFDNLVVLEGGAVFKENGAGFDGGNTSSFLTGGSAIFRNNVYFAADFTAGTATELPNYDIANGLAISGNYELAAAPKFNSKDLSSPDFYRPVKNSGAAWTLPGAAWTDGGLYADFIGAKKPNAGMAATMIIMQ
jgi:hypothetical protein